MVNFSKQTLMAVFVAAAAIAGTTTAEKPCYPLDGGETKCWDPTATEATCTVEGSSKEIPGCCPPSKTKGFKNDKAMACVVDGGANQSNENLADAPAVCYPLSGGTTICFDPTATEATCTVDDGQATEVPGCCPDGITDGFMSGKTMTCVVTGGSQSNENLADTPAEDDSAATSMMASMSNMAFVGIAGFFIAMAV